MNTNRKLSTKLMSLINSALRHKKQDYSKNRGGYIREFKYGKELSITEINEIKKSVAVTTDIDN